MTRGRMDPGIEAAALHGNSASARAKSWLSCSACNVAGTAALQQFRRQHGSSLGALQLE